MRTIVLIVLPLVGACGVAAEESGDDTGLCADAPAVGYETWGAGFLTQNCQTCHASTSPDRHEAPAEVSFDDAQQAWEWADRILVRAAGTDATMPPLGGTTEADRYLLEVWLSCGDPGT